MKSIPKSDDKKPNDTITGRLFAKYAPESTEGIDFEIFVQDRRASGRWPEFDLALSIKERIPDGRIEDILRDMQQVISRQQDRRTKR